jgi:hypothetical protein
MSIAYGLKAPILLSGKSQIYEKSAEKQICGINFKSYFDYYVED